MKQQLRLSSVILLALFAAIGPAAAQSAVKPTRSANSAFNALVPPVFTWTGFYVGGNLGGSFGRATTDFSIAGLPFANTSQRMDGVVGGLQGGYNWQSGRGVFGWEADIQGTSQRGRSILGEFIPGTPGTPGIPCIFEDGPNTPCLPGTGIPGTPGIPAVNAVIAYHNALPWFGTFRGRLGFTPAERWLVYATAGLAYGDVTTNETLNVNGAIVSLSNTALKLGWTAGLGIERAIINGWIVRLEYLYIDFGHINNTLIGIAPITPVVTGSHVTDNIVRVGFSYGFRP
jgi:outer membrane immunogenic protein